MAVGAAKPTNEELIERLQAIREQAPEVGKIILELWAQNINLVRLAVHKLTGLNVGEPEFEDMEQQAFFGFHAAAYAFNLSGNVKFSTYAINLIRWELCRYYERNGHTTRIPAYMKTRLRHGAEKQRQLEAETGRAVTLEAALQALDYSPAAIAGTLAAFYKLETASLDAEAYTSSDGDGVSLLDKLADGADVETDVIGSVWQQELHALLFKALREIPADTRAVIVRRYFVGRPYSLMAHEIGVTPQTLYDRVNAAFQSIRAGEYGPELAEFCPTESRKARADRLIQKDREAVRRLQLTDDERGLLAL